MKIAQVAPLMERVPPRLYGGTERIVSYLTEELVHQGDDVTLFASGDSETAAELVPCCREALRLDTRITDPLPYYMIMLDRVRRRADEFDILHFHTDFLHFPVVGDFADRTVTTLHGRLDLADLPPVFKAFPSLAMVSISDNQRLPLSANWVSTVYHGLPRDLYPFAPGGAGGYLAFLGRISPEKRADRAIAIAKRTGLKLKIAAKVDKVDQAYFDAEIRQLLDHPLVEFIGEISEHEKAAFLGGARALLFPIDWPEPFGLVMIEAMACGTPVVAWANGSVPEVIDPGITGYVVDGTEQAVAAVDRVAGLDRRRVRARFETRFSAARMAADYLRVYEALVTPEPKTQRAA